MSYRRATQWATFKTEKQLKMVYGELRLQERKTPFLKHEARVQYEKAEQNKSEYKLYPGKGGSGKPASGYRQTSARPPYPRFLTRLCTRRILRGWQRWRWIH